MTVDLTKLVFYSGAPAFKQNNVVQTGTFTISGSTVAGTNTQTFTASLLSVPDMVDIVFNGPTDTVGGQDPRPVNGWFKQGAVWVPTNNAGGGNPAKWEIYSSLSSTGLSGATLTVTAVYVQQFTTIETMTSTNFFYRVIDYSVF